jgi:hypothetical protein
MKLLIAGSRDYPSGGNFKAKMAELIAIYGMPSEVVSGHCHKGVDAMGEDWAAENKVPVKRFAADWNKHGKAAGPIRNREMAPYCDRAFIFWDGKSRGSKNMIEELQRHNKPYTVVYPPMKIVMNYDRQG